MHTHTHTVEYYLASCQQLTNERSVRIVQGVNEHANKAISDVHSVMRYVVMECHKQSLNLDNI